MISEIQLQANRKNCLKSTGPRTLDGKRTVSRNAVRHGLLSNSDEILINGEDQDEFDSFRQNLLVNLAPQDQLETLLVERITGFFWKLKRAGRMEKGLLEILCTQPMNPAAPGKKGAVPFEIIIRKAEDRDNDPDYQEFLKSRQSKTADSNNLPSPQEITDKMFQEPAEIPQMSPRQHSQMLGRVVQQDFSNGNLLERLLRYEGRIEGHLYRALTELQKFQFIRKRNDAIDADKVDDLSLPTGEASVLHNNDKNMLTGDADCPCSISEKSVPSVVPVSLDTPKPNKAISV